MTLLTALLLWWPMSSSDQALPDWSAVFLNGDRSGFNRMIADELRVETDLRPLLNDRGGLSRPQLLLAFDKLHKRFAIRNARVLNSQSDTNYAWLEVYVALDLTSKHDGLRYQVTFAFHFKLVGSRLAISRWVLQDLS